jgi:hypothetical protein
MAAYLGVAHLAPYLHGRSRAQNDLKYQIWSFPEGEGYYPASTFSDGVAYLYSGYPQDDFADGIRLSKRYIDRWTMGYRAVVENAGYALKRTDTKPARLPYPDSAPTDQTQVTLDSHTAKVMDLECTVWLLRCDREGEVLTKTSFPGRDPRIHAIGGGQFAVR